MRLYEGDQTAEIDLIRRFDPIIRRRVQQSVHSDPNDVDDLVAEVHLALLESVRAQKIRMDKEGCLGAYIYGITQNKIHDHYTQTRRLRQGERFTDQIVQTMEECILEQNEIKKVLRREITRLPMRYQTVLYLRYYRELSIGEISEHLDLPRRRISERLHYAIKVLRKKSKKKLSIFFNLKGILL